MNHFCTYCDKGYAARMLCLHESLKAQGESFRLLVLCFDAETEAVVAAADDESLVAIPLAELMAADPAYAAVRSQRSRVEFYFTATPVLVRHCFAREAAAERMTYLDADLFFFGPASVVFAEQGDASVGIVPHRFPPHLAAQREHGTYNVAWVSFRRDADGLACLDWWRARCLEWCFDRVEAGRFADQGYLDEFPKRFRGVKSLEHPGINAAPWNVDTAELTQVAGLPWLQRQPVLFYHYQGIREVTTGWFDPGLRPYQVRLTQELRGLVYLPYLRRLADVQLRLRTLHGIEASLGYKRLSAGGGLRAGWERFKAGWVWPTCRRMRGELVHCPEKIV
jgi:hypothetical protein